MVNRLDQLVSAAEELLQNQARMEALMTPACPEAFVEKEVPSSKQLEKLNAEICTLVDKIAEAIRLNLEARHFTIPHPSLVAEANAHFNAAHPAIEETGEGEIREGWIDRMTQALEGILARGAVIKERIVEGNDDFSYVFDIRADIPEETPALIKDCESLFLHMFASLNDEMTRVPQEFYRRLGPSGLFDEFTARENEYRKNYKDQYGRTIHETISRVSILHDDFFRIIGNLAQNVVDTKLLMQQLTAHYFQTLNLQTNTMVPTTGLFLPERENPGEHLGIAYQERIVRYLAIARRVFIVLNIVERTILLLKCRKS